MTALERPSSRPQIKREEAVALAEKMGCRRDLFILILRGYYRDTMGEKGANDIGIYDDAVCIISPSSILTFNANCDPSKDPPGTAILQPGMFFYSIGTHNITKAVERQYKALIQAQPVVIKRVGSETVEVGFFGINGHRGGEGTTGSLGCWTIVPEQYEEFIEFTEALMHAAGVKTIPVVLTIREVA